MRPRYHLYLSFFQTSSTIKKYENASSIISINSKVDNSEKRCDIHLPTTDQINKIIKKLNLNKATGPDKIAPEIEILSANIIDCHLASAINHGLNNNSFSEGAQIAIPSYLQKGWLQILRVILNCFLKVYERLLHGKFKPFWKTFLLGFPATYRERNICNHVLMRLIEN